MKMRKLLLVIGLFGVLGLAVITSVSMATSSSTVIIADGDEYGNGG